MTTSTWQKQIFQNKKKEKLISSLEQNCRILPPLSNFETALLCTQGKSGLFMFSPCTAIYDSLEQSAQSWISYFNFLCGKKNSVLPTAWTTHAYLERQRFGNGYESTSKDTCYLLPNQNCKISGLASVTVGPMAALWFWDPRGVPDSQHLDHSSVHRPWPTVITAPLTNSVGKVGRVLVCLHWKQNAKDRFTKFFTEKIVHVPLQQGWCYFGREHTGWD